MNIGIQDIKTIILGVVSSGLFAMLIFILNKLKIIRIFVYYRAKKRVQSAGIVTFYSQRSTFTKDAGTIGEYISQAKKEVNYIGYWLSNGLHHQDLGQKITELINRDIKFNFCLISPKSPLIDYYADYLGETKEEIIAQIMLSINTLKTIYNNLQGDKKDNLKIYLHDKMSTVTFWIIDPDDRNSMIQLDHKIYGLPRHYTYGFQIIRNSSNKDFYNNLKRAYLGIIKNANKLEDVDLTSIKKS